MKKQNFVSDEKAQTTLELLIGIPSLVLTIIVAVIVFASAFAGLSNSTITGNFSAAANNSISQVNTLTYSGISISSIGIIVLAGTAMLGLIFSLRGFGRGPPPPRDRF